MRNVLEMGTQVQSLASLDDKVKTTQFGLLNATSRVTKDFKMMSHHHSSHSNFHFVWNNSYFVVGTRRLSTTADGVPAPSNNISD